jgi:pimeloyl-ACP methyl ester carboxylesterase
MILLGAIMSFALFVFDFSDAQKSILISCIYGILVFIMFVFISGFIYKINLRKIKNKEFRQLEFSRKMDKIYFIGILIMIISIIIFINSFLYVKALLGNDMLVSLKVDEKNFLLKNGEDLHITLKAKVLTNPFCQANCSLILEDLSDGKIVDSENHYLQFSSPLSKDYLITINEDTFGQRFYRVELECNSTKNLLCYVASETSKTRTELISVNHELNDAQKKRQEELKNRTETANNEFYILQDNLTNLNLNFYFLDLSAFDEESYKLKILSEGFLSKINNSNTFYEDQKYYDLERELSSFETELENFDEQFNNLSSSVCHDIISYNFLVDNITAMYNEILFLYNYNFSNSSIIVAESFINNFNSIIPKIKEYNSLEDKKIIFSQIESEKDNLFSILINESNSEIPRENVLNISIYSFDLPRIEINNKNYSSNFTLGEPSPICCLKNECYKCIDDSSVNYPIILVHGHSFNEKISAELSLEAFSEFSKRIESDGYIYAGDLYGSRYDESSQSYLGTINNSVVIKTTYYIDIFETEEGSFILESKGDNIDTYARRLNEVVLNVKYLTGKDKVIIVAHSMGGLVTRKYIQLYGEENLDRVVLVGIPNNGVDGFVLNYCPILGADAECADLSENSPFLTELNNDSLPNIPVYNIVGLGCFWENSDGDGIVKNKSAYLEGAENVYVNGTCRGFDFFHVNMIKPSKYPEIYEIIKNFIEK